jgi:hypothetical protein
VYKWLPEAGKCGDQARASERCNQLSDRGLMPIQSTCYCINREIFDKRAELWNNFIASIGAKDDNGCIFIVWGSSNSILIKSRRFFVKRLSITIVILFMVSTMACKNSSEIPAGKGPGSNSGTTQSAPASPQSSTASPVPAAKPIEATTLLAPKSVTAPGMNPPHGQPNHRCDIAVGAPLDSPPGKRLTQPVPSQLNVPAQTTTPSTAPGMNPPHGQPNHRCDIAVGAPLDSPPAKPK